MIKTNQPTQAYKILTVFTLLVVGLYFFFNGIMSAAGFLIPITISVLLVLICIPLARKLEKWGLSRGFSALLCVLISFIAFISFFAIISFQISQFSDQWPEIKNKALNGAESIEKFVSQKTGYTFQEEIDQIFTSNSKLSENQTSSTNHQSYEGEKPVSNENPRADESLIGKVPTDFFSKLGGFFMFFFGFLGNSVLVMIYLFFLLFYRTKLKSSILNFFKKENKSTAKNVLGDIIQLALDFLVGRIILIAFLAAIYTTGLSISGIENALLISIIAAVLSLIPYVGNMIGVILAVSMAALSGGELKMYIGVGLTYFFAQFIESYILQPYLVGGKVNINPFVSIIIVVLGGTVWGVAGMILSIPLIGIFKIICDAVPDLQPVGYFLGEEDLGENQDDEPGFLKKLGKLVWSKISGKN